MKASILAIPLAFVPFVLVAYPGNAGAQELIGVPEPELAPAPPWSAAIDGYAGFGVLIPKSDPESFSLAGGLTRLRYRNFMLGGLAEYSSFATSRSLHVGGALGGYLPFRNFVDLEGWFGVGIRRYLDDDVRYGAGGYKFSTPALSFRIGVSDRAGGVLGGRIGAQLGVTHDLDKDSIPWEIAPNDQNPEGHSGVREVGGTSVVMLFVVGLDVAPGAE